MITCAICYVRYNVRTHPHGCPNGSDSNRTVDQHMAARNSVKAYEAGQARVEAAKPETPLWKALLRTHVEPVVAISTARFVAFLHRQ